MARPKTFPAFSVADCATLGTKFADIYQGETLFAREVPRDLAVIFCADPLMFGNVHVDTPMLRTWVLEQMARHLRKWPQ